MAANAENGVLEAVRRVAGPYLSAFAPSSSLPESFWAALTANECGGDLVRGTPLPNIKRREPAVFQHLAMVAAGFQLAYGSIKESNFIQEEALELARPVSAHAALVPVAAPALLACTTDTTAVTVQELLSYATSWGFTQLMGYHAIEWKVPVADLADPGKHYPLAAKLMAGFCESYGLDPAKDFEGMARCWNTGRPDGATYDPHYVTNLLLRMKEW